MGFVVKRSEAMQNKTFRFPVGLLERLERIAEKEGVSVNEVLRQAAEYALSDMKED